MIATHPTSGNPEALKGIEQLASEGLRVELVGLLNGKAQERLRELAESAGKRQELSAQVAAAVMSNPAYREKYAELPWGENDPAILERLTMLIDTHLEKAVDMTVEEAGQLGKETERVFLELTKKEEALANLRKSDLYKKLCNGCRKFLNFADKNKLMFAGIAVGALFGAVFWGLIGGTILDRAWAAIKAPDAKPPQAEKPEEEKAQAPKEGKPGEDGNLEDGSRTITDPTTGAKHGTGVLPPDASKTPPDNAPEPPPADKPPPPEVDVPQNAA